MRHVPGNRWIPLAERFWAKVEKRSDGHWLWLASLYHDGYGKFSVDGKHRRAHRVAWELCVGPIPEGRVLDHVKGLCPYRHCVNPVHLRPVTQAVNVNAGDASYAERTHCKRGHPLENNIILVAGRRLCRTCKNDGQRRRYKDARG